MDKIALSLIDPSAPLPATPGQPPKLLDQLKTEIRLRHYSIRTEQSYVDWAKRYIFFHGNKHPKELGEAEIRSFLSHLAIEKNVSASTQNQALNALVFLYKNVLKINLGDFGQFSRAQRPQRRPLVLSREEVSRLLNSLDGPARLMAELLYGTGMRLMEGLRLRVKDIDFGMNQIIVRDGKGGKDRVTVLPAKLRLLLERHLAWVKALHEQDLAAGFGRVNLPQALAEKYPDGESEWGWQYVFPAKSRSVDPRSGTERRHHWHPTGLQKAVSAAVRKAGIDKPASVHTLRHSFAAHLLQGGTDIRTVQDLLGHKSVTTTMIYTHVLNQGTAVRSPLDQL